MRGVGVMAGRVVRVLAPNVHAADLLFRGWGSAPEVRGYMSWRRNRAVGEPRRVITEIFNVGGETTWLIELRSGLCGWRRPQPHIVDFGYYQGRRWWRQGIMSEAVQLLLDKAQRDRTVYRVTAHCHVDNIASARLLERSGLTLQGRLARYAVLPNISLEPQDRLLFGKALRGQRRAPPTPAPAAHNPCRPPARAAAIPPA